jgi:hypothetical protein
LRFFRVSQVLTVLSCRDLLLPSRGALELPVSCCSLLVSGFVLWVMLCCSLLVSCFVLWVMLAPSWVVHCFVEFSSVMLFLGELTACMSSDGHGYFCCAWLSKGSLLWFAIPLPLGGEQSIYYVSQLPLGELFTGVWELLLVGMFPFWWRPLVKSACSLLLLPLGEEHCC